MTIVIDASAALPIAVSTAGFASLGGHDLNAPALLWSEVTSVLRETAWRREITADLADLGMRRFLGADVTRHARRSLYREAAQLAAELGWAKTYDAEYVALARRLDAPLLTMDARLSRGVAHVIDVTRPDDVADG